MKLTRKMKIAPAILVAILVLTGVAFALSLTIWFHQTLTVPKPAPSVGLFMSYNGTAFSNPIPSTSDQSSSSLWQWYQTSNSFNASFYVVNIGEVPFNFSIGESGLNTGWGFHFIVYGQNTTLNYNGAYRQVGVSVYNTTIATGAVGQSTGDFRVNVGVQY